MAGAVFLWFASYCWGWVAYYWLVDSLQLELPGFLVFAPLALAAVCTVRHKIPRAGLSALLALTGFLGTVCIPSHFRALPQQRLTQCKHNLKSLADKAEAFATSHPGRYSDQLDNLPVCPSRGSEPYFYFRSSSGYTIVCQGVHREAGVEVAGYPQYTSAGGLLLP